MNPSSAGLVRGRRSPAISGPPRSSLLNNLQGCLRCFSLRVTGYTRRFPQSARGVMNNAGYPLSLATKGPYVNGVQADGVLTNDKCYGNYR